jgi:hypothetical protein
MKIKMYENFESEKYYISITPDYANKLLGHLDHTGFEKGVNFTEREIDRIKSVYSNIKKPSFKHLVDFEKSSGLFGYVEEVDPDKKECVLIMNLYSLSFFGKKERLEYNMIYKLEDDWFVLKHMRFTYDSMREGNPPRCFRCDQMDGLIRCVEDFYLKYGVVVK